MDRIILHSDLNNFYASVECVKNPALKNECVAVCGSGANRHGIVLAKNQNAKKYGIKTGDVIWQAKQKCPDLVIVEPDFPSYYKYSEIVRKIYYSFTDMIEPFGIDECWLDVTGSTSLFGSGEEIANKIREKVKRETSLTVSVGVSFNKIFAKLASDIKKPDAVTVINRYDLEKVWKLPASDLLGVGKSTKEKLLKHNINTIGDIAVADITCLKSWLGKSGEMLWHYANGLDASPVVSVENQEEVKSVGHGTTTPQDLKTPEEVTRLMHYLTEEISLKLKRRSLLACGVSVTVKDCLFTSKEFRTQLDTPTHSSTLLARAASSLFKNRYKWENDIRAITVTAINLVHSDTCIQTSLFQSTAETEKLLRLENCIDDIKSRYGDKIILKHSK